MPKKNATVGSFPCGTPTTKNVGGRRWQLAGCPWSWDGKAERERRKSGRRWRAEAPSSLRRGMFVRSIAKTSSFRSPKSVHACMLEGRVGLKERGHS